jgi:transcriptional regulator with XRE-family HTH domain
VPKKNELEPWWFTLDLKILGEFLKIAREAARLSLRDLAEKTGISTSQILRIESGEVDYSLSHFFALCSALGLVPGDVVESSTDFETEGVSFSDEDLRVIAPKGADLGNVEGVIFQCWDLAARLIWSTDPLGRAINNRPPGDSHYEHFCEYATMISELGPTERRLLLQSLWDRPIVKLKSLQLIPTIEEWPKYLDRQWRRGPSQTYPASIVALLTIGKKPSKQKNTIDTFKPNAKVRAVTWHSLKNDIDAALQTFGFGTRRKFARYLNVSDQVLSAWLRGKAQPSAEQTLRLVDWVELPNDAKQKTLQADQSPKGKDPTKKAKNATKSSPKTK